MRLHRGFNHFQLIVLFLQLACSRYDAVIFTKKNFDDVQTSSQLWPWPPFTRLRPQNQLCVCQQQLSEELRGQQPAKLSAPRLTDSRDLPDRNSFLVGSLGGISILFKRINPFNQMHQSVLWDGRVTDFRNASYADRPLDSSSGHKLNANGKMVSAGWVNGQYHANALTTNYLIMSQSARAVVFFCFYAPVWPKMNSNQSSFWKFESIR